MRMTYLQDGKLEMGIDICDRVCKNRSSERKLKFSAEQKPIFAHFELHVLDGSPILWAHSWRFIVFCNVLWGSYDGKYKGM